jgi:uncharacterized protein YegP (UPF0339 family)
MTKKPSKFVIKPGKGPNAKARIVYTGGNGETILFGEGLKGGTAAAKKAIAKIKKEVSKAKIEVPKAPVKKTVKRR